MHFNYASDNMDFMIHLHRLTLFVHDLQNIVSALQRVIFVLYNRRFESTKDFRKCVFVENSLFFLKFLLLLMYLKDENIKKESKKNFIIFGLICLRSKTIKNNSLNKIKLNSI